MLAFLGNQHLTETPVAQRGEWELHPQLQSDTVPAGDLALSRVLVMRDANFPWLVLVPRQPRLVEIIDLSESDQAILMTEIAQASRALKSITQCDKLNVAALGNTVAQLHVHVVARFRHDIAGPRPVWGAAPPRPYEETALHRFAGALKQALALQ
jgi:diadenosine tetraphosphate (Ap4A) HIT family hydrolase